MNNTFNEEQIYFKNYYSILGVDRNASHEELKNAFREKAKQVHPDIAQNLSKERAHKLFILIREAFDVLSNKNIKAEYDIKYDEIYKVKEEKNSAQSDNIHVYDDEIFSENDNIDPDIFNTQKENIYDDEWEVYYKDLNQYLNIFETTTQSLIVLIQNVLSAFTTSLFITLIITTALSFALTLAIMSALGVSFTGIGAIIIFVLGAAFLEKLWNGVRPEFIKKRSQTIIKRFKRIHIDTAFNLLTAVQLVSVAGIIALSVFGIRIINRIIADQFFSISISIVYIFASFVSIIIIWEVFEKAFADFPKPKFSKVKIRRKKNLPSYEVKILK